MKICIVGLGYVGLPLAVALSKHYPVIGFDVNSAKIGELNQGIDKTNEVSKEALKKAQLKLTTDPKEIKQADFIIVAVPTPIDNAKRPDLKYIENASELVGANLKKGAIVVYESTVYPGCTEEVCLPILEKESGLKCGVDFKIGYSPERINPGDKEHTINTVTKIVSGIDKDSLNKISEVYSKITSIFKAKSIKIAEAAKVIENIQRDLNIALMNELSLIFNRMDIETKEVLEAAGTKWNFHKYYPGLVGGHCIGVDPYYLTHKALSLGYHPRIILAGRDINEYMSRHTAEYIMKELNKAGKVIKDSKILVMGLSFKENVPDVRNSKAKDVINHLKEYTNNIFAYDPLIDEKWFEKHFSVKRTDFDSLDKVDCILVFSPHDEFKKITLDYLKQKMNSNPILMDIKGFYNKEEAVKKGFVYKRL
jgi:UDP-N-acetyl-D-galactosamine dehydrogenase